MRAKRSVKRKTGAILALSGPRDASWTSKQSTAGENGCLLLPCWEAVRSRAHNSRTVYGSPNTAKAHLQHSQTQPITANPVLPSSAAQSAWRSAAPKRAPKEHRRGQGPPKSAQSKVSQSRSRLFSRPSFFCFCLSESLFPLPHSPAVDAIAFPRTRNLPLLALIPFLFPFPLSPVYCFPFFLSSLCLGPCSPSLFLEETSENKTRRCETRASVRRHPCPGQTLYKYHTSHTTHTVRVKWPVSCPSLLPYQTRSVRERTLDPLLPSCPVLRIPPMKA